MATAAAVVYLTKLMTAGSAYSKLAAMIVFSLFRTAHTRGLKIKVKEKQRVSPCVGS